MSERPGIVDMRDLAHRYMWDARAIVPFVAALGLDVAPAADWRGHVVQDAIREGRHDAAAQLRASHPTREMTGERFIVAVPGTRNVIELADSYLRVI